MKPAALIALVLGLVCLIGGSLWTSLFTGKSEWTAEKDQRSAEIKARLAYLGGVLESARGSTYRGLDPAEAKTEFEALKKEDEQLNTEFKSAYEGPRTASKILKWTGISFALLGLIGWYAAKNLSG